VRVTRTKANLRRDPADHWVLTYCWKGATTIGTGRRSLDAPAGVPFLWSLGEMSESERSDVERVQLFLARDAFSDLAPLLDAACWSALDTPLGRLLGDFMLALERRLPGMVAADRPRLNQAVGALVAACVAPSAQRVADARSQIDASQMERVRQAVRARLRSPNLNPATLCRAAGISRSGLYRLFEGDGVARYIQEQRLFAAHAALCDVARERSISSIASEFCFADSSSFSRAFRHQFGNSPSDVRAAALSGQAPAATSQRPLASVKRFGDLLSGI
jgi:AraC-like DNA-binding protein